MLEQAASTPAAAAWHAYPGMAFGQALALRADENAKKHGVSFVSCLTDFADTFRTTLRVKAL